MTSTDISVQRAQALRRLIEDEAVLRIAGNVALLPMVPGTYDALCRAAADPDTDIADITRIIEADPAISVRLLQLVNSAFFGAAQRTASIPRAVNIMGTNLLKSLVLSVHMSNALELQPLPSFSMQRYQSYSIRVGRLARRFAGKRPIADDAFTAGIVLGIGKVLLALRAPQAFEQVLTRVVVSDEKQYLVERELLGTTHAEAGAYLLSTWDIPLSIVECVAFQYRVDELGEGNCELLALVHAADALCGIICCREPEEQLSLSLLARAGMLEELPRWRRMAEEACEAVA